MANSQPIIRPTVPADLDAISEIYAHHVRTGVATFEVDPPDASEWEKRFGAVIDSGLPFISAEMDGAIAGYAYCVQWKSRPAYRHTVEDSIYFALDAVIVDDSADASLALHRNRGFVDAGRLSSVGFKHGRWLDTLLLQRTLNSAGR